MNNVKEDKSGGTAWWFWTRWRAFKVVIKWLAYGPTFITEHNIYA